MLTIQCCQAEIPLPDGTYSAGWAVTVAYTDEEVLALLAAYDPTSPTSPSATVCRPTMRTVLDAVIAAQAPIPQS
jgi:hypothetical protein